MFVAEIKATHTSSYLGGVYIIRYAKYNIFIVRVQRQNFRFRNLFHILCVPYNFVFPSPIDKFFIFYREYWIPGVVFAIGRIGAGLSGICWRWRRSEIEKRYYKNEKPVDLLIPVHLMSRQITFSYLYILLTNGYIT